MGTDYVPFELKNGVTEDDIVPWVRVQALSFQSMPYYWARGEEWKRPPELDEILVDLHKGSCLGASEEISKRIDKTQDSYRIYAVTENKAFPIKVRIGSMTTILPSELSSFINNWSKAAEVANHGPWQGKTDQWISQMEWFKKFIGWAKDKQKKGLGLYLCW